MDAPLHYLAPGEAIRARLAERLAGLVTAVLSAADLAGVEESRQPCPAVHVIFGGDRPLRVQGDGAVQESEQRWWAVVAVRNLRTVRTGADALDEAGPILGAVHQALQGWRPAPGFTPLHKAAAPAPRFSRAGYAYIPTAWTTRVVTRAKD